MFIEVGSLCYQWPIVRPFSDSVVIYRIRWRLSGRYE